MDNHARHPDPATSHAGNAPPGDSCTQIGVQQSLLDAIDAHAAVVARDGTIVAVNAAWHRFAAENGLADERGLATSAGGIGSNYFNVCRAAPAGSVARDVADAIERVLTTKAFAEEHEYPCHSPQEKRWFIARVGPLVVDDVTYALVTHQNVTRLKLIEHDVRTIAEGVSASVGAGFFRSMAHCLREALAVDALLIDELIIDDAGPTGHGAQMARTLAGSGIAEPLASASIDLTQTNWPSILAPNAPTELSLTDPRAISRDQRFAPWPAKELLALPVMGTNSACVGVVAAVHRDPIARPAHAADVLRIFATRVAAEIERLRVDASLRVAEARARESQKLDAVGQLAAGVAHEVNNVFTALDGQLLASERAIRAGDPDAAAAHLGQIRELASHTRSLSGSLLTYARKTPMQKAPCDLAQAVEAAADLVAPSLPRTIDFHVEVSATPTVLADATQIRQIVTNLVLNARDAIAGTGSDATHGTAGAITVRVGIADGSAVLEVADTGGGMPEAIRSRVFEPFYTTKPSGVGTGLGLSVVHGIVHEHHGEITVESSTTPPMGTPTHTPTHTSSGTPTGTRFTIRLPRASTSASSPARYKPRRREADWAVPPMSSGHPVPAGRSVLVVEDNAMVRRLAATIIRAMGHEVTERGNGRDAADLVAQSPTGFHLILMDLNLPGLGGLDSIAVARKAGYRGSVILSTGSAHIDIQGLPTGVSLLEKPYESADLEAAVTAALEAASCHASEASNSSNSSKA